MPTTPLQEATALATHLHWLGLLQLWIGIRPEGIALTKEQVKVLIASRGEKQIFGPQPRALGKSLAEDVGTRWQMDLADLKNQK